MIRPQPVCPGFGYGFANNTLGTCECNRQLFIADACHKVKPPAPILKSPGVPVLRPSRPSGPGHTLRRLRDRLCGRRGAIWLTKPAILHQFLVVDPHNGGSWRCEANLVNEESRPIMCPGKFNTGQTQLNSMRMFSTTVLTKMQYITSSNIQEHFEFYNMQNGSEKA